MVLSKPENFSSSLCDFVVFRGYLALCGPSVEHAVSKLLDRVPVEGRELCSFCLIARIEKIVAREKRVERDGKSHHITIFSRKDLSALAKIGGESKVGMTFVSR